MTLIVTLDGSVVTGNHRNINSRKFERATEEWLIVTASSFLEQVSIGYLNKSKVLCITKFEDTLLCIINFPCFLKCSHLKAIEDRTPEAERLLIIDHRHEQNNNGRTEKDV